MLPMPTATSLALFTGTVASLLVGILASSVPATMLGSGGLLVLAFALTLTMPLGRRVRRQRLEFAWWLEHATESSGGGAVVPGHPFEIRCYIRHRGVRSMLATSVHPVVHTGADLDDGQPSAFRLHPRARTEFTFRLVAPAAGRVVLHGLALTLRGPLGLFEVPLYFPNPLALKVLPRAAVRTRRPGRTLSSTTVERSSGTQMRRRGGGTELYELRELQPGDPFNSIAWKASARFGRLMVKEVEREVQETRWLLVDVSGSMRGGKPGSRKLDFAIEAAAQEARIALQRGHRVGLITVDGRVLGHVPPGDAATQMPRIYDTLLAATEVVDEDLTDVDDDELVAIVGRYVRHQDGIDFAGRGKRAWDVPGLVRHVEQALREDTSKDQVRASTPVSNTLRRFCRLRGIALPYRPDPRDGSKGPGLAEALRLAGGTNRSPSSIFVLTDFDGIVEPGPLMSALKLLRAHGHAVSFVLPEATSFASSPDSRLAESLHAVYSRSETRRLREARQLLGRIGIPAVVATRREPAGVAVERADKLGRVA